MTSFRAEPVAAPAPVSAAPSLWTPGGPPAAATAQPDAAGSSAPAAEQPAEVWPRPPGATPPADEKPAPPWAAARSAGATHDDDLDDEDDDDEPSRRLHPYTWLHVLVLAVVAFVLGFLIMLLVIQTRPDGGGAEAQSAPAIATVVAAVPA
ncbi:hypothetical protein [Cellulomonas xiejunii]|uniref:Uncharacterized protein n=1 Tax=Cellulomonas xiejunii TaxID=2968083 RepID=A0ABY5KKS0_9CELL|nr:hypothetical protein [Cellulomonas xiejunii]MCC2320114.1 hypothetical protein [Cellulomonas xiejunii]UUI70425.1 hypothetical protein NP048_11465 [Cellulomonas xiejunii]